MIDICRAIADHIGALFTCQAIGEYTRIRSPFMYPDGDYIDVFVRASERGFTVTDMGEAGRWLRSQTTSPHRSPKQGFLILDACQTHGVTWYRGMVLANAADMAELPTVVLRVAQATLRISDLWFTLRQRTAESIVEDVSALLNEAHIEFERNVPLVGRSQKPWRVDFQTYGANRSNLVEVLSTGSRAAGQSMVKHVVTVWHDLSYLRAGAGRMNFVTLFDDTSDVWSQEDFALVSDLSEISYWSRPNEFVDLLAA